MSSVCAPWFLYGTSGKRFLILSLIPSVSFMLHSSFMASVLALLTCSPPPPLWSQAAPCVWFLAAGSPGPLRPERSCWTPAWGQSSGGPPAGSPRETACLPPAWPWHPSLWQFVCELRGKKRSVRLLMTHSELWNMSKGEWMIRYRIGIKIMLRTTTL